VEPQGQAPGSVRGWFVVEVGVRQAWPFLGLADPESGREVRLYIDSTFSVAPGHLNLRQHDDGVFAALETLNGQTITTATATSAALDLDFGGVHLRVDGQANELTSHESWWFGRPMLPPGQPSRSPH
jgi:hypothetical protein